MKKILICKIQKATIANVIVTIPNNPIGSIRNMIEPKLDLSQVLSEFDQKKMIIGFKVFNSLEEIERKIESAKTHNKTLKLNKEVGRFSVVNKWVSTDLDEWFERSVKFEICDKNRTNYKTKEIDFHQFLEKKEEKILYLEIE